MINRLEHSELEFVTIGGRVFNRKACTFNKENALVMLSIKIGKPTRLSYLLPFSLSGAGSDGGMLTSQVFSFSVDWVDVSNSAGGTSSTISCTSRNNSSVKSKIGSKY